MGLKNSQKNIYSGGGNMSGHTKTFPNMEHFYNKWNYLWVGKFKD